MRYLLDSHTFIWLFAFPDRLGRKAKRVLTDDDSALCLSSAAVWELGIKHQLGKLELPEEPEHFIADRARRASIAIVPIEGRHALRAPALPMHHRDPFDRMMVAQAIADEYTIITNDKAIHRYDVACLW